MSGSTNLTTADAIQKVALDLFAKHGFEATKIDDIAAAAGIGRRTFFRYFPSKNDIPFGDMEPLVRAMEDWLANVPDDVPLLDALTTAVVRFNTLHTDGVEAHRERMMLIHRTPALQAHRTFSLVRWQDAVARFAGRRLGADPGSLAPQLIGQLTGAALTASYNVWLDDKGADLDSLLFRSFAMINLDEAALAAESAPVPEGRGGRRSRGGSGKAQVARRPARRVRGA